MNYIKEAEEYLRSYSDLKDSIVNIKKELEYLELEITGAKAIDYSGMPGGGAALPDDRLVNLLYKKQVKEAALESTENTVTHIKNIFENLSGEESKVLKAFYIEGLRGTALEEKFELCERQVYNLRQPAIRKFAKQLFGIKAIGE
jgi:hypothetical protein